MNFFSKIKQCFIVRDRLIGRELLQTTNFSPLGSKNIRLGIKRGSYLPVVMLSATIFIAFASALASLAMVNVRKAGSHEKTISALGVAEAGINYYIWHLSHSQNDYCDDNTCDSNAEHGPYTHDYTDNSGKVVGRFTLYITPPTAGGSVVKIKSAGNLADSRSERVVTAEIGVPSFAGFAFLSNTECWFGTDEVVNGPVHSNVGVHFDGTSNGVVSASSTTYKPSAAFGGDGLTHDGVWGEGGPKGFWVYPEPPVDFNKISSEFARLKDLANSGGIILEDSKSLGYYLLLKSNGTIDLSKVTKERDNGLTLTFIKNYAAPANGVIYIADNVWVDGTYHGRVTIAAEKSNQSAKITIKDNLLYDVKDGTTAIGLVAQGNVEVARYAPSNLEIDAAMLSQNGHVWFPEAKDFIKNKITTYGAIASGDYWRWRWLTAGVLSSGYAYSEQNYDPFLTLTPPPEFPTTGTYSILSWREE